MVADSPPIPEESPDGGMYDAFVSYSRRDADFVDRLVASAEAADHRLWVDRRDIRPTVEWWTETREAIERSDNFVTVVSRSSVGSKVCAQELDHAIAVGKKLVIISPCGLVSEDPAFQLRPWDALRTHQWLTCERTGPSQVESQDFDHALRIDHEWARLHTLLLVLAKRWDADGRSDKQRLSRGDVRLFRQRLKQVGERSEPRAIPLQLEYIDVSEAVNRKRLLQGTAASTGLTVTMALLGKSARSGEWLRQFELQHDGALNAALGQLFPGLARGARPSHEEIGKAYRSLAPAHRERLEELIFLGAQQAKRRGAGPLQRVLTGRGWKDVSSTVIQIARRR